MSIKSITLFNLDDARCEEINIQRGKLLSRYERLIPRLEEATGWDKVDIQEAMLTICDELEELNDEYESLTFCTIE